jgi:hypothetical protein
MKGQRVEAAVRVLCQTGVPGPVQRVSAVVSDRHASDRCAEHLRDARDRYRLVFKIGQAWSQPPAALLRVLRAGQEFGQHSPASSASGTPGLGQLRAAWPERPIQLQRR